MKYRCYLKRMILAMSASGVLCISDAALASALQIWEQDGASIGNYHAGRVALADDASIAFYNPAGMVRIKNQQAVFGGATILTDVQFRGTVAVNTLHNNVPQTVSAQGGIFGFIPNFHYVSPINDRFDFGLSIAVPFGLKVAYGRETILRYASMLDSAQVFDLSPAVAYRINDKLSAGVGFDVQKMSAEFDQIGVVGSASNDTDSTNKGFDTAYGYHLGLLYQFNPETRAGLAFNSQVVHHLRGTSKFMGPIANAYNNGQPITNTATATNITLPPFISASLFRSINPVWSVMGTVIYTEWDVMQQIVVQNVSGISPPGLGVASNQLIVTVPQHFHNSWNLSFGTDYHVTDHFMLRAGVGYDQTPTNNSYRNVQMPDGNRVAVAFGGHYQATKTVGLDLGWTHLFIQSDGNTANVNPPLQISGKERVTTHGSLNSSADVFGAAVTWDML